MASTRSLRSKRKHSPIDPSLRRSPKRSVRIVDRENGYQWRLLPLKSVEITTTMDVGFGVFCFPEPPPIVCETQPTFGPRQQSAQEFLESMENKDEKMAALKDNVTQLLHSLEEKDNKISYLESEVRGLMDQLTTGEQTNSCTLSHEY